MVSKVADKSSNTNKLPFPFPIVEAISLKTLKSAVSQLWPALYADLKSSIMPVFERCL